MRLLAAVLLALLVPLAGASLPGAIQPGVLDEASGCTLNFAYDGLGPLAGRVFLGTAAHCVALHDVVRVEGRDVGRVVYVGDAFGVFNAHPGFQHDFALVEVDEEDEARVVPDVAGHPGMPRGVKDAAEAKLGDAVLYSGHGLGFHLHDATRENRTGVYCWTPPGTGYWQAFAGLVSGGDSGGPVLHEDGYALGSVQRTTFLDVCPAVDEGPTTMAVLAELAPLGWPVALRTAS